MPTARKATADTSTFLDTLSDLYTKMIPLEERKRRILTNAGHAGLDARQLDADAFARAAEMLTNPKKQPPPSDAPGFEGTPMGQFIDNAA